jgi:hypothetical protein
MTIGNLIVTMFLLFRSRHVRGKHGGERRPETARVFFSSLVASVILLSTFLPILTTADAAPAVPTGIMVPLFSYHGPSWSQLIKWHQQYPTVPMVAVVNPALGPGPFLDPNFEVGIRSLQNAGIPVLGYIATHYAHLSLQTLEATITNYRNWYHVNGTVLDQMNNTFEEGYYSAITSFDRSIGMTMTVGNPGTEVPSTYVGVVDMNVIYESPGVPSLSFVGGWHTSYPKSNWVITAYGVPTLDVNWVLGASQYVGYLYITDGVWPDPYTGGLPSYMNTLMSTLASVDA